ncbi:hypothetical protein K431DRAFT_308125 [Polychaeton citri CBS 116435]|uniref:Uncharacterized protein n=1 Tax=Polychaeton citri CBS 116435 TaxID=1314669 RepID=A0A9P4UHQ9_9PEZI|nr:hypothetical protein K431DRAFT_308125 [Polychaeton citri CBS 116435]
MPRVLPWLKDKATPVSRQQNGPANKRQRAASLDNVVDLNLSDTSINVIPHLNTTRVQAGSRSPSTSPPPAPPDVEYMIEGCNADDQWMMVEDEFTSIAHLFTNHIHHAEYVRLKKLARRKGEDALRNIIRPTDGRAVLSRGVEQQNEVAANVKRNDTILQARNGDESEGQPQAWRSDTTLSALMLQDAGRDKDLRNLARQKVNTRAAAGYSQSPHNRAEKKPRVRGHQSAIRKDSDDVEDGSDQAPARGDTNREATEKVHNSQAGSTEKDTFVHRHNERLISSPSSLHPSRILKSEESCIKKEPGIPTLEISARRRARREKREKDERERAKIKQEKTLKRFDDIPTFMV